MLVKTVAVSLFALDTVSEFHRLTLESPPPEKQP